MTTGVIPISNVINLKQDVSTILKSEAGQYATLAVSILTTTDAYSFTSTSSGVTYSGSSGGQQQLFNDLAVVLVDNSIAGVDWNLIRSFIYGQGTPMLNGMQTKLVKVNGVLKEVDLYKADLTTLIAKTVLNRTSGILSSVDNYVYSTDGVTVLVQYKDTLNRVSGALDNVVRTVQI